jgi:hypothetical protein
MGQVRKQRRTRNIGGGYQASQQMFDPAVLPPHTAEATGMSAGATDAAIRPILRSTFQTGAGYGTSQQMFDPAVLPPHTAEATGMSAGATDAAIRPILVSDFHQTGAGRTRRMYRGGFSPSIMGPFLANAQRAIVPMAFYTAYHTLVPKTGDVSSKSAKTKRRDRRSRLRNARSRR